MKIKNKKHVSQIALLLISSILIQGCSSSKKKTQEEAVTVIKKNATETSLSSILMAPSPSFLMSTQSTMVFPLINFEAKATVEVNVSTPPKYEDFDKRAYPNEAFIIANMISVVQPELRPKDRDTIAEYISIASKKFNIEPQIIVSIIDTESNFNENVVSNTGDYSLAQINISMWNREFTRMKMPLMKQEHVESDTRYAIKKMAEILSIIKKRHEKRDPKWYARYHSNTGKYKNDYISKLQMRMKMLATSKNLNNQIAQLENIKRLSSVHSSNMQLQAAQNSKVAKETLSLIPISTPKIETGLMMEDRNKTQSFETASLLLNEFSLKTIY
jgi:hypothetical protein